MDLIRATKALVGSVLTTLSCSIVLLAVPAGAEDVRRGSLSDRFEQDFRQALDPALTLYGVSPGVVTKTDRSGLSINIAAARAEEEGAGVATRFQISGDFEITISYELRSDKRPETGFGAGLKIWMSSGVPPRRAMTFAHMRRQKSDNQRVALVASWDDEGKKSIDSKTFDATASRGKMRMTRAGPTIYFLHPMKVALECKSFTRQTSGLMISRQCVFRPHPLVQRCRSKCALLI